MKLEIKKFDPSVIKADSVLCFIGKRCSGKSYLLRDILSYHESLKAGIVISPTEQANQFFQKFIPNFLIYDEFQGDIVKKFLDRQIKITKQANDQIKKYGTSDIDPRAFLILDDCLYDRAWPTDKSIRSIFMNGRHYKIFFLLTMQYCLGLPPILRANIDYVFIFKNNMIKEREKLYNHYAGMFNDFGTFCKVMDHCTTDFSCLVIDNKTQSNKLEDQVKWYKAKDVEDLRLCSPELWNLCAMENEKRENKLFYDEDEEDNEPDYDPSVFIKNKNKVPINIKKKN
jgi:hypothetical protein